MQTIYVGEQRNGRIKMTSDRDCLSPDIVRVDARVVPNDEALLNAAKYFESRGYTVCIDTETLFYETGEAFRLH